MSVLKRHRTLVDGALSQMHGNTQQERSDRRSAAARIDGWTELFGRYEPFHHFTTFTFERPNVSETWAREQFRRHVDRIESRASGPVAYAAAFAFSTSGYAHVHALLKGTQSLGVRDLREPWRQGFSHAVVYDSVLGARGYLGQHVWKPGQRNFADSPDLSPRNKFLRAAGEAPLTHAALRAGGQWHYARRPRGPLWCGAGQDALGQLRTAVRKVF
jgi:hypothetical protein